MNKGYKGARKCVLSLGMDISPVSMGYMVLHIHSSIVQSKFKPVKDIFGSGFCWDQLPESGFSGLIHIYITVRCKLLSLLNS